jgi:hypothetical protein
MKPPAVSFDCAFCCKRAEFRFISSSALFKNLKKLTATFFLKVLLSSFNCAVSIKIEGNLL